MQQVHRLYIASFLPYIKTTEKIHIWEQEKYCFMGSKYNVRSNTNQWDMHRPPTTSKFREKTLINDFFFHENQLPNKKAQRQKRSKYIVLCYIANTQKSEDHKSQPKNIL